MRIVDVRCEIRRMGLALPYEVAYARFDKVENVFVEIEDERGRIGRGAASPEPEVTGETIGQVVAALEGPVRSVLLGRHPRDRPGLLHRIEAAVPRSPALRAAVELALLDLVLGAAGLGLSDWLGRARVGVPVNATVGIRELDETLERARKRVAAGAVCLKLKGGLDVETDLERVRAVAAAVGPDIALWFDANQGYSVSDCLRFAAGAVDLVRLIEQPTPAGDLDALAAAAAGSALPVFADEAVQGPADVLEIVQRGAADGVNLKLMKLGGVEACRAAAAVARSGGLAVMIGCMDESALTVAAGVALACSLPGPVLADLDGDMDLLDDPFRGHLLRRDGTLTIA